MKTISIHRRDEKAQALLEFAIVFLVLFVVVFGVLVLAQAFHVKVVLNNAAREAARYLSVHPGDKSSGFAETIAAAQREAQNSGVILNADDITVTLCIDNNISVGCDKGFPVEVRVEADFEMAWAWLFPNSVVFESRVRMMVP